MAGYNYAAQGSVTYDTSAPKFGSGALTGAYTDTAPTSQGHPGGISGPTGLTSSGWSMEFFYKRSAPPASQTVVLGTFGSSGNANANSFFIQTNSTGLLALNTWDSSTTVQTTGNSSNVATGAFIHVAVTVTPTLASLYVGGVLVGTTAPSSGHTYSCTPPTIGIGNLYGYPDYPDTGAEYDEFVVWPTARYTAAFTPPTSAYVGTEGMNVLLHFDSNLNDSSAAAAQAILPNNASIIYSPYNWTVPTTANASTINSGAYFKTLFTGGSLVLNFNVTNNSTPLSEIYYRIDGYEAQAPWTVATVAPTITCAMPANTTAFPYHLLEVVVKSTSQQINRWNSPSNTAVVFTGLTLSNGGTVAPVLTKPKNILIYGDSISEGVRTVNQTSTNDPDQNDVMMEWSWHTASALAAEFGIVAFGGSGLTVVGEGNVPVLTTTYNLLMAGVSRAFSPAPDLIVLNEGSNDGGSSAASVTTAMTTVLNDLLAATPGTTKIVVMEPFGAYQAAALQAAVIAVASPRVTYLPTTGFLNTTYGIDSTGYHPTSPNAIARIAPQCIGALLPILFPSGSPGGGYRGGMF